MALTNMTNQTRLTFRYGLGILAILIFSLALFYWLMRPPLGEFRPDGAVLSVTAVIPLWPGTRPTAWVDGALPCLGLTLMGIYALASIVTFFNVWITARADVHQPARPVAGHHTAGLRRRIAMVLGYFFQRTDSAHPFVGTGRRADETRPAGGPRVGGNDELAALGNTFNQTAARLQEAAQRQRELETLRREFVAWAGHDLQTLWLLCAIIEPWPMVWWMNLPPSLPAHRPARYRELSRC
jgi:hypothetical protein